MSRIIGTKKLIEAASAINSKGQIGGIGAAYRTRVYAIWAGAITAGVVTIRHRMDTGDAAEDIQTLGFITGGGCNSAIVDGPVGEVEAEITVGLTGGGTVTVKAIAFG